MRICPKSDTSVNTTCIAANGQTPDGVHPEADESIVMPDGTPIRLQVVNGFSTATAKMGDLIEFIVPFAVRVDGIIVVPHGTLVNAKVLERTVPRRGSKDAVLNLAFEEFKLPSANLPRCASSENLPPQVKRP